MCSSISLCCTNDWLHHVHRFGGLSREWLCACLIKLCFRVNDLPHLSHGYSLLPVCTSICRSRFFSYTYDFPHSAHLWRSPPECSTLWAMNKAFTLNVLSHCLQWYDFIRSCTKFPFASMGTSQGTHPCTSASLVNTLPWWSMLNMWIWRSMFSVKDSPHVTHWCGSSCRGIAGVVVVVKS